MVSSNMVSSVSFQTNGVVETGENSWADEILVVPHVAVNWYSQVLEKEVDGARRMENDYEIQTRCLPPFARSLQFSFRT